MLSLGEHLRTNFCCFHAFPLYSCLSCLHFVGALALLDLTGKGTSDDRMATPGQDLALEGLRGLAGVTGGFEHGGPSEFPGAGGEGRFALAMAYFPFAMLCVLKTHFVSFQGTLPIH